MMEMTLKELFSSLAIIEQDAAKIWFQLNKAFPPGHFHGVIEDMVGGSISEE